MKMSSLPNFWFSESYSTDRRVKSISVEILKDYHQEDWQFVGKSNSRNFCYEEVFFREKMNMLLYSFSLLFSSIYVFFQFSLEQEVFGSAVELDEKDFNDDLIFQTKSDSERIRSQLLLQWVTKTMKYDALKA